MSTYRCKCRKCGKDIGLNKLELCQPCRKATCKVCGRDFRIHLVNQNTCSDCSFNKKAKLSKLAGGVDEFV